MNLTDDIKKLIRTEYKAFEDFMYAGKTKEQRDELAQFFTPPEVSIKLLEAYNVEDLSGKVIRDPTSGSGNLLAAALIAGADSNKIFGNDYDKAMVNLCKERLNKVCDMLGKPHIRDWQIHQGNALIPDCLTKFGPDYNDTILKTILDNNWLDNPEAYINHIQASNDYGDDRANYDKLKQEAINANKRAAAEKLKENNNLEQTKFW